jgi:hypothetical protein
MYSINLVLMPLPISYSRLGGGGVFKKETEKPFVGQNGHMACELGAPTPPTYHTTKSADTHHRTATKEPIKGTFGAGASNPGAPGFGLGMKKNIWPMGGSFYISALGFISDIIQYSLQFIVPVKMH